MKLIWQNALNKSLLPQWTTKPRTIEFKIIHLTHTIGTWYWHQYSNELSLKTDTNKWEIWKSHQATHISRKIFHFDRYEHSISFSHVASVHCYNDKAKITGLYYENQMISNEEDIPKDLMPWKNKKLDNIIIATDSTCKDNLLTYGMMMKSNDLRYETSGGVPSHKDEANSHRAELGGIQQALETINKLTTKAKSTAKKNELFCDNRIAVNDTKSHKNIPHKKL